MKERPVFFPLNSQIDKEQRCKRVSIITMEILCQINWVVNLCFGQTCKIHNIWWIPTQGYNLPLLWLWLHQRLLSIYWANFWLCDTLDVKPYLTALCCGSKGTKALMCNKGAVLHINFKGWLKGWCLYLVVFVECSGKFAIQCSIQNEILES